LEEHAVFAQLSPARLLVHSPKTRAIIQDVALNRALQANHVPQQVLFPEPLLPMMTNIEPRFTPALMSA